MNSTIQSAVFLFCHCAVYFFVQNSERYKKKRRLIEGLFGRSEGGNGRSTAKE